MLANNLAARTAAEVEMNTLSPGLYISLIVVVALWFALRSVFIRLLWRDHHEIWVRLGEPRMLFDSSLREGLAVWKFLRRREYAELGDMRLTRLGRALDILMWVVLLIMFGLLLASMYL